MSELPALFVFFETRLTHSFGSELPEVIYPRGICYLYNRRNQIAVLRPADHGHCPHHPAGFHGLWSDLPIEGLPWRGDHDCQVQLDQHQFTRGGRGGWRIRREGCARDAEDNDQGREACHSLCRTHGIITLLVWYLWKHVGKAVHLQSWGIATRAMVGQGGQQTISCASSELPVHLWTILYHIHPYTQVPSSFSTRLNANFLSRLPSPWLPPKLQSRLGFWTVKCEAALENVPNHRETLNRPILPGTIKVTVLAGGPLEYVDFRHASAHGRRHFPVVGFGPVPRADSGFRWPFHSRRGYPSTH